MGFVSGTYADTPGVLPLTGAPTIEQNGIHTNFVSPVFFPQKLATVNYFGALDANGTDGRTRLITTPAQYRSDVGSTATDTERRYSQLGLQLYYSSNTTTYGNNTPALAAPPSISGVTDTVPPGQVAVSAHVTGDPSAGIQHAWVTYTAESGPLHGTWQSSDLAQDPVDSTLWTGTFALPSGQSVADVRYIVQAVNGVGLVGLDNNLGDGYTPGVPVGAQVPPPSITTLTALEPTAPAGVSGTSLDVAATVSFAPAGSAITFSLGSVSITATADSGGRATATLPLQDAVGDYTVSATYGGDTVHSSSSSSRPFSITKVPTALTVAPGTAKTISALLSRTAPSIPLPQQTVYFTVTGPVSKQVTSTTDPQGRALVPTGALPDGTYTVSAEFSGTPSTFTSSVSPSTVVTIDTAGPTLTALKLTPASIVVGGTTKLTASVADASAVSRVEYFVGTDPGVGSATSATLVGGSVSAVFGANLQVGTYTVGVRALDLAGNWSATSTTTLTVTQMGLSVSTNANRTGAIDLAGSTVSGNIAVFATPATGTSRVAIVGFYLDDPNRTGLPYWVQLAQPVRPQRHVEGRHGQHVRLAAAAQRATHADSRSASGERRGRTTDSFVHREQPSTGSDSEAPSEHDRDSQQPRRSQRAHTQRLGCHLRRTVDVGEVGRVLVGQDEPHRGTSLGRLHCSVRLQRDSQQRPGDPVQRRHLGPRLPSDRCTDHLHERHDGNPVQHFHEVALGDISPSMSDRG